MEYVQQRSVSTIHESMREQRDFPNAWAATGPNVRMPAILRTLFGR